MTPETFHAGANLGRLSDVTIIHGDCIEAMRELADNSVDAIVTDPPYGLGFMGKEWDALPPGLLWAQECLRVLKPGGHLLAFGGTRTSHRLAVAVEDAGFEIRDSIAWLYGSGFPKSLDVSKAIDKTDAAAARLARARKFQSWLSQYVTPKQVDEATSTNMGYHYTTHPTQPSVATLAHLDMMRPLLPDVPQWVEEMTRQRTVESENFNRRPMSDYASRPGMAQSWTDDAGWNGSASRGGSAITPEAEQWQGWGTALKPAFEPVVVGRKPFKGNVAANVLTHGTGALNIDACRIETTDNLGGGVYSGEFRRKDHYSSTDGAPGAKPLSRLNRGIGEFVQPAGRWPANVILDESQAAALDEQSGTSVSPSKPVKQGGRKSVGGILNAIGDERDGEGVGYGDSCGASRFFFNAGPSDPPFRYCAKAPKKERPVVFRPSCNCETIKPWQEASQTTDTDDSRSDVDKSSSTSLSGSRLTVDQSQPVTTSTTATTTNSTTTSATFNSSPSLSTSGFTQAANSATVNGGNPAASAMNSSPSPTNTGTSLERGGHSTDAVDPATLHAWSSTSVCANCGAPARSESHSTVKPLTLMRWLVRLVTPPGGLILDPFAGSGTTVEAALLEGFRVIGIERGGPEGSPESHYLPMIQQRIARQINGPAA